MAALCLSAAETSRWRSFTVRCEGKSSLPTKAAPSASLPHRTLKKERLSTGAANEAGTRSQEAVSNRRNMLFAIGAVALSIQVQQERAAASEVQEVDAPGGKGFELEPFVNTQDSYSLLVPKGWTKGEGSVGTRRLVAFHPEGTTAVNVSVLLTPLGADFTTLGSFGTAEAFGEALVNGQDRSYLRKPGQKAVLLNTKSSGDVYYVEYTIQKPGEDKVHLTSAVAVHFNGIYNQLYTLTAQYLDETSDVYGTTIKKIVDSFKISR